MQLKKFLVYLFLILISIFMMIPILWMFSSSLKLQSEIFSFPPTLIPKNPTIYNFLNLFKIFPFGRNLFNSFIVSFSSTVLSLFFCSLAAFGFAKYKFPGRKFLFLFLLVTMIIPFHATMIPLYIIYCKIGWINKFWGLIFPGMANAFGIFFMRQYMLKIPDELLDAARIDGCSEFKIFLSIILHIAKPALAALGIITFMRSWNDFFWPLIILKSNEMLTSAVVIRYLQQSGKRIDYGLIMAGSTLTVIPLIILFIILQKQFISGISSGSIKG